MKSHKSKNLKRIYQLIAKFNKNSNLKHKEMKELIKIFREWIASKRLLEVLNYRSIEYLESENARLREHGSSLFSEKEHDAWVSLADCLHDVDVVDTIPGEFLATSAVRTIKALIEQYDTEIEQHKKRHSDEKG